MTIKTDESEEFKDELIKSIVKESERSMPNPDFEFQMMLRVQQESAYKKEVAFELRTSVRFFQGALFAAFGLTLASLFGELFVQHYGKTIAVLALFVIAIVGVLNLDNYQRLIKKYS